MIKNLKHVNAGDLSISYYEAGPTNGTPIILLHGFPYDIHAYKDVSTKLTSSDRRILIPYLRGYGKTRFLKKETLRSGQQAALASDLFNFMNSIKIEKAILAGYDWGGRAACIVSALYPERSLGLVSCMDITFKTSRTPQNHQHHMWNINYGINTFFIVTEDKIA